MWVDVSSDWRPVRKEKKKKKEFRRPAKCHEDTKCVECVPQWVGEMKKDEKFKKKKKRPDMPPFVRSHVTKTHGGNQSGLRVYACTGSLRVNRSTRLEHAKLCRVLPTRKRPRLLLQCVCLVDVVDVDVTDVSTAYHRGRVSVHYSFEYSQALLWNAQLIVCRMISIISSGCCCCCQLLFFPPWPFSLLLWLFPFAAFFSVPFSYY